MSINGDAATTRPDPLTLLGAAAIAAAIGLLGFVAGILFERLMTDRSPELPTDSLIYNNNDLYASEADVPVAWQSLR